MQKVQESPSYVQTSMAGAMSLGLASGRFLRRTKCTCLNLLLVYQNGCRATCSYCGLACNRDVTAARTFIRVKWPIFPLEEILGKLRTSQHSFKRACISMITHPRSVVDTCIIIKELRDQGTVPVSALLTPTAMKPGRDLALIRAAGADRVGIAIDAATEKLFELHRGRGVQGPHRWERYWETVAEAVDLFGQYHVGVHLIVGLGETEQEMAGVIARAYRMGALTHLFSFFPEAGSRLEDWRRPDMGQYRRLQLARYLINEGIIDEGCLEYNTAGQITGFGLEIEPYVQSGLAFITSGCPGEDGQPACNRPFGNERASEPLRNYPFVPEPDDIEEIGEQIWDGANSYVEA
ncbi:MAG: radical SAM protein [Thermacetogeniaceae bacterium]